MLTKRIQNWFTHFQKYFFVYKNGFFELSYLANSPKSMLESFFKMPFIKHDVHTQTLKSNTPFVSGMLYYQEIEGGLWIICSNVKYKTNVRYSLIYDKFIECNYYFLSYNVIENEIKFLSHHVNNITLPTKSWSVFKPQANVLDCHFKNNVSSCITIYFNDKWLQERLLVQPKIVNSNFGKFFNSPTSYLVCTDYTNDSQDLFTEIFNSFKKRNAVSDINLNRIKDIVLNLFVKFSLKYEQEKLDNKFDEINNPDRLNILKIEKYLLDNLQYKFVGIDYLARHFHTSATKLKADFRITFGKPIYQFFQEKQMELAWQLFNNNYKIKDVAEKLGYENVGKFSNTFKKYYNHLPSQLSKNSS